MSYNNNRKKLIQNQIISIGYLHCTKCGASNAFKFHCHHIIFRSEKPKHTYIDDVRNLIIICNTCHDDFHNNKSLRNEIVKKRELNKLFGNDVLNK